MDLKNTHISSLVIQWNKNRKDCEQERRRGKMEPKKIKIKIGTKKKIRTKTGHDNEKRYLDLF